MLLATACGSSSQGSGGQGGAFHDAAADASEAGPGHDAAAEASEAAPDHDAAGDGSMPDGSSGQEASAEGSPGDSGDGAAGPVKGGCASDNLTGCYRGMYVSLYTEKLGQLTFGGETEAYRFILGEPQKEQKLLDFIEANRIEAISLYNLNAILQKDNLKAALQSFMERARQAGLLRIEAIGATSTTGWDQIAAFHNSRAPFDGFVTEIEFWNGGATWEQFVGTLQHIRALPVQAPGGGAPTLSVYAGWLEQQQADAMAALIDRVYLHVYVDQASQAFGYGKARLQMLANANASLGRNVDIWPIFSAEDHKWAAGPETFMGEWLAAHGVDAAEKAYLTGYEGDALHGAITVSGFQYYEYFFLDAYLP
jgi:hypothetical protein